MFVFKHDSYIDSGQIWTTALKDVLPQTTLALWQRPISTAVSIVCSAFIAHGIFHSRQDVVVYTHHFQNNSSTALSLLL